jgi:hypothetical protein
VKKELRPVHDIVACDVCGRTILKGERTEPFVAPGGQRQQVCDLCYGRAEHHGWIRESVAESMPARTPRSEPRRGVFGRLRRRGPAETPQPQPEPAEPEHYTFAEREPAYGGSDGAEDELPPEAAPAPRERPRSRPKDPRHVRAVPTTAPAKVERALELFNRCDHQRTISGLTRTLGAPLVAAQPDPDQPGEVSLVVAWELSWYRFRIDLGDEEDPVMMLAKGEELDQLEDSLQVWNASVDADGRVVADAATDA